MRLKTFAISATLAPAALAAPASASLDQCGANYMCAWGNNEFDWLVAAQYHDQCRWLDVFNDANGENDQADSCANQSSIHTGCLAWNADGSGTRLTMAKGTRDRNLAYWNSDQVSAIRTKDGC